MHFTGTKYSPIVYVVVKTRIGEKLGWRFPNIEEKQSNYINTILERPDDTLSRPLAFRPLHHG